MCKAGFATVDWSKSKSFYLEFTCLCGQFYIAEAPTIQCPKCRRVFHTDLRLAFLPEGFFPWDEAPPQGPGNCFQWKNVLAHLDCHCGCGCKFERDGNFLYEVTCPSCNVKHTNPVRLTFQEIAESDAPGPIRLLEVEGEEDYD